MELSPPIRSTRTSRLEDTASPAPRSRAALLSCARLALVGSIVAALAGCGREPAVRLADYVGYQRDHVTTRWVPAGSDLATRLAVDGWTFESAEDDQPRMRMTRDRARVWFYSRGGTTVGVELHGRTLGAGRSDGRTISYRVNDEHQTMVRWRPESDVLDLPFKGGAARDGWNALDLFIRREGPETERGALELAGLRFRDREAGRIGDERPHELRVENGEILVPAEGVLEAAFEVPARGRLRIEATNDSSSSAAAPLSVSIALDGSGAETELGGFRLDAGDTDRDSIALDDWAGQTVALRLAVDGPRGDFARFVRAEVTGGERRPAGAPIRPSPVEASHRLRRPDIFLIVLDAARADAFGAYGGEHATPNVDALAEIGTTFLRAQSPSSWTGQSIPALLAGFYPDTLGIERWADPLPDQVPGLGELMAEAGYRTVLWSQHPIYSRTPSLARGFEHVRYSGRGQRYKLPPRMWLFERDRPTFALIHLLPPHSPYSPPAPFEGRYTEGYSGKFADKLGALGRVHERKLELTPEDHAYIRGKYQENVAFADWLVGEVLRQLTRVKRFSSSLVIVTSDHGEAFYEHGQFMHSRELYQEFVRIPLIVKWPEHLVGFAQEIGAPVTLVDVAPTLVDGLGLEAPRGFQGVSLLPAVLDGAELERAIYGTTRGLGDVTRMAQPRWMLEEGSWRAIHDPIAGTTELYSTDDAGDSVDLATKHPLETRRLLQRLLMQRDFNLQLLQLGPRAEIELDPETAKELRALGYL